jgi:hypothetical protein
MTQPPKSPSIVVGKNNYLFVDGVKIARLVPERGVMQFLDRDRRRCAERGSETVEVRLSDLANLPQKK